jgi:hypothetical protein
VTFTPSKADASGKFVRQFRERLLSPGDAHTNPAANAEQALTALPVGLDKRVPTMDIVKVDRENSLGAQFAFV